MSTPTHKKGDAVFFGTPPSDIFNQVIPLLYPAGHPDAHLIQHVQGDGDEHQRHQVGRSDDGRDQHDEQKGMLAVTGQQVRTDKAQFRHHKRDYGQLEHQTHEQCQRGEGGDIAVQRDGAVHPLGHAIRAQKPERDGKEHVVTHQHADNEQQVNDGHHPDGISPLVLIERRRDKAEQFIQYIRRRPQQSEVDGRGDVGHELARQVGGYQVHMVFAKAEVGKAHPPRRPLYPPVGHKVPLAGCQEQPPRDVLQAEHHHGQGPRHTEDAEHHAAQHL